MSVLLFLGRLLFGGIFVFNGLGHFARLHDMTQYAASRGVPMPEAAVIVSGTMIVLGGLSVIVGIAPRIGLWLIVAFLIPVSLVMHSFWAMPQPQRMHEMVNFVKNVGLCGGALGLMAVPVPWRYALDELLRKRWPNWTRWSGLQRPLHGM
jgi:putative oxidoreductase